MDNLLFSSKQMRLNADKILSETHLLETLSTLGIVKPIGGYAFHLMHDPDIDIIVRCDRRRESAIKALDLFVRSAIFSRYELGDFVQFPQSNRPNGYILVLQYPFENKIWEIEIWFIGMDEYQKNDLEERLNSITTDQRRTILQLKQDRASKEIDKKKLSSIDIYEGVLVKGYKSLEDFLKK